MRTQTQFMRRALLGGVLLVASATTPAHAQFGKISEKEEIQAGQQMSQQAVKEYGQPLSSSDPRQQRVTRIGAMFARDGKRKSIPYSYTVLQNDKVLNAFAGPGGPIFVTTKLIDTAANDAELAYVLGHETGHIEHKHIVNSAAQQQKVGLGVGILGAIIGRGGSNAGGLVNAVSSVGYTLWTKGFSRKQESDADDYGVHAMSRLGFDPRAAVSMLGKLGDGPDGLQKLLADHPTSQARRKKVSEIIQADNLTSVAQQSGGLITNLAGDSSSIYGSSGGRQTAKNFTNTSDNNYDRNGNTGSNSNAIALRIENSGGYRVVLAPIVDVANYAGGEVKTRGDRVTVSRGDSYATFSTDSDDAVLNGRRVQLSAPARVVNGRLYAPLGTIASGLDGSASYDQSRNAIRLTFDGAGSTYLGL